MRLKVLIVGSGAREHALAWKVRQSPSLGKLWVAGGNAGTSLLATNVDVHPEDVDGIIEIAKSLSIDLVIIGPDIPLAKGIVDSLQSIGIPAFGPTKAAAKIEWSKSFALEVMDRASVTHPKSWIFSDRKEALAFLLKRKEPIVVKADGLAAGKGVWVCKMLKEATSAVERCIQDHPGEPVVLQELLEGREVSVFAFSDGAHTSPVVAACDYKRVFDGNEGANTGGMGSFAPPEFWTDELAASVSHNIIQPVIDEMARRNTPFCGVLYGGLMITNKGAKVLEFNSRFGDPETQVMMPLLKSDPLEIMMACTEGRLDKISIEWDKLACVGVIMASYGYPGTYETGLEITGLGKDNENSIVFHAGTTLAQDGKVVTNGGRVLTIVGKGNTLTQARTQAYNRLQKIHFTNAHYRSDIAKV